MTMEDRLSALEDSSRRWRGLALAMVALATSCMMLAMHRGGSEEIVVRKITIVDSDGRSRIVLAGSGMILADESEQPRIVMATMDNEAAAIQHFDPEGRRRIAVGTFAGGNASVLHLDPERRVRFETGTYSDGTSRLTHFDDSGAPRLAISTDQSGGSSLETSDSDGVPRVVIATDGDGLAEVRIDDQLGRTRLHDQVEADGRVSRELHRDGSVRAGRPAPAEASSPAKGG